MLVYDETQLREPNLLVPGKKPVGHVCLADGYRSVSLAHLSRMGLHDSLAGTAWYNDGAGSQATNSVFGVYYGEPCKKSRVGAGHTRHAGIETAKHAHTMFGRIYVTENDARTILASSGDTNAAFRLGSSAAGLVQLVLGGVAAYTLSISIPINAWCNIAVTHDGSSTAYAALWSIGGGLQTETKSIAAGWSAGDGVFSFGGLSDSYSGQDEFLSACFYSDSQISNAKLNRLVTDPFSFVEVA